MPLAIPLLATRPAGYDWLEGEPDFDAARHLQLEAPATVTTLAELGYGENDIRGKATELAISSPFRVLSDDGAEVLLATARRLRAFARPAADRIERSVRGGCYRSRWLRDLCLSEALTTHLGGIYGTSVAPHPMGLQLGHLNYEPSKLDASIDKWHHDTLPLDIVMPVTDPGLIDGGRFEYFLGTRAEAAALAAAGKTPPRESTVAPEFPGVGYAVALHGDMVVHRASPLHRQAERISMVNGYVALDTRFEEQCRTADLVGVDNPDLLWAEWGRFAAWRAHDRLTRVMATTAAGDDAETVIARLEDAVGDVNRAISEMRGGPRPAAHYGG